MQQWNLCFLNDVSCESYIFCTSPSIHFLEKDGDFIIRISELIYSFEKNDDTLLNSLRERIPNFELPDLPKKRKEERIIESLIYSLGINGWEMFHALSYPSNRVLFFKKPV